MDIFLTGGSGFAGRHIIGRLLAEGHTVRALARSPEAAERVTRAGAEAVRGDLSGSDWLPVLKGCDAVVHAAARMEFWGPDAGFERDNHRPTVALFAAAAAAGVERFVLISAAAVSTGRHRGPAVVAEDTPTGRPLIAYARVKLATEQALAAAGTPGMTLVILRPPFIWGAGMTTLDDVTASGRFAFIDGGRHVMDFVHAGNLASATSAALRRGRDRGVYYVTDGTPMPVRDFFLPVLGALGTDVSKAPSIPLAVASPVARVLDLGARAVRRPTPPPLHNWLIAIMGRDRSYDIGRARAELDYRPGVTFQDGLAGLRAGQPSGR
ncbi:NAD-dependent epimerase/dehydratase family protein [Actinoplanes sp. RD1]|uniref:NAD-dependent epimerase/dehydratase family protein n=1 Tax=Actinoplanes sp. RD1 TaxID=3064538 RepID=UPI002741E74A|nr:NAD(P)-dependent oxidoreductase [Actinoplanes sp. RD1]